MKHSKLLVFLMCILLCLSCTSCGLLTIWDLGYKIQEKKYYADKSNFVSVEAVCMDLSTNEHFPGRYYINVENMVYERTDRCKFIDSYFEVNQANSAILKEAGIEEKLTGGTTFTFFSAPEYFGDGYCCPIVGLEINGEVLLDFETGYTNLMATYGVFFH